MRKQTKRIAAFALNLVLLLPLLFGCAAQAVKETPEEAPAVDAAQASSAFITIEDGDKQVVIQADAGLSIADLLKQAGIELKDGDILSVDPDQIPAENMTVRVLHKAKVLVVVAAEDPLYDEQYTAVLYGGTVQDAIEAVGVKMTDTQEYNFNPDDPLENEMAIVISEKTAEATPAPSDDALLSGTPASPTPGVNNPAATPTPANNNNNSTPTAKPTAKPTSKPTPTPGKTVVSTEVYEDCDGSGHGVKIITYSDGTQEEIEF